jgi:hypothetical protein
MGSSMIPLFRGRVILTSLVSKHKESRMLSILTHATLPSLLKFSSKFFAFWKTGVLKISANNLRVIIGKNYSKDSRYQ